MLKRRIASAVCVLVVLTCGCSYINRPLNPLDVPVESRARNHTRAAIGAELIPLEARNSREIHPETRPARASQAPIHDTDGYFVGLAISGGGSRSANFGAAAMFQLQRLGFLQRVDYISAVSGGSLPAAYYCTQHENWNPQTVQSKLTHAFANDVLCQTLLPWNWFALTFSTLDRTDLLADSFGKTLFTGPGGRALTYADLREDRPRLLVNATDLQSGKRFIFCDETFDEINSDLSRYPIARAVAGSSAVPVLLHQLTLRDFSTTFDQYRHVIDGAIADNLGAETLIETFVAHVEQARGRNEPDPYPHGAVLVFLDATVEFDARLSDKADINVLDSMLFGAGLSTTSLLNRASSATMAKLIVQNAPDTATAADLRDDIRELSTSGHLSFKGRTGHNIEVVHIALTKVDSLSNVPFMSFRESVNNIATYFNIDRTEAYHLYQAAELLVKQRHEPRLRELVDRIDAR